MTQKHDVDGLIEYIDKVNYDHIPLVLQYLTDLSESGWHDLIISHGAIPRAIELMRNGSLQQKKYAMFLIYSLISHGRSDIVIVNDHVIEAILDLLDEEEDKELYRGVAYCMSMLNPIGGAPVFIQHGGIEKIAPLVKSDDEMTVLYTLFTLNTISSMGFQKEIIMTKVHQHIGYHMSGNSEIETLGQMLLDDLYGWKEESFSLEESELEIIDEGLELIGIEDGYMRPDIKKNRIEPRDGTILGYDGKAFEGRDEREVMIELKSRRLIKRKAMKDKSKKLKEIMEKRMKKDKDPVELRKIRTVKQRIVKQEPKVIIKPVERKIVGVTSGSLDDPENGKSDTEIQGTGSESIYEDPSTIPFDIT
jgi:hypothetical protein